MGPGWPNRRSRERQPESGEKRGQGPCPSPPPARTDNRSSVAALSAEPANTPGPQQKTRLSVLAHRAGWGTGLAGLPTEEMVRMYDALHMRPRWRGRSYAANGCRRACTCDRAGSCRQAVRSCGRPGGRLLACGWPLAAVGWERAGPGTNVSRSRAGARFRHC